MAPGKLSSFFNLDVPQANGVATAAAIADYNNDTYPDLAVTFANVPPESGTPQINGSVWVFMNKTDGTLNDFTNSTEYDSGGPFCPRLLT